MKVAVVGAGRIAEQHFRALAGIPGLAVAACDRSAVNAEFAAERFGLARHDTDFAALLAEWRPDVVHVTTPVGSHVPLALQSLAAGAHVLVEKPIAPSYAEWVELRTAAAADRWLLEDHPYQFSPAVQRVLRRIEDGSFGEVVHVDAMLCVDIAAPGSVFADTHLLHPSHAAPGGPISDFLTHLAAVACLFVGRHRSARTLWRKRNPAGPAAVDELRSLIEAERGTASLTFSANAQPDAFVLRVFGARETATLNLFEGGLAVQRRWPGNSALTPLLNGFVGGWNGAADAARSLRAKLAGRPESYQGLRALIVRVYAALRAGEPPPIDPEQIDAVQRLIDDLTGELKET